MTYEEEFEAWFKAETWRRFPPGKATEVKPYQKESYLAACEKRREVERGKVERLREINKQIRESVYVGELRAEVDSILTEIEKGE